MNRLDRLLLNAWFPHVVMLVISGSIVLAAALMTPSSEAVSFFGWEVPVLCGFRQMTGMNCPGCGLTRSFTFLAHGRIVEGFQMNYLGPVFFAFVAAQIPYRLIRIARYVGGRRATAGA